MVVALLTGVIEGSRAVAGAVMMVWKPGRFEPTMASRHKDEPVEKRMKEREDMGDSVEYTEACLLKSGWLIRWREELSDASLG